MGCHGLLNGLRVARAFVEADASACVLLCAVELCSLHFQYGWDAERMVANALFADGAAAMVHPSRNPTRPFRALTPSSASGSTLLPDCEEAMIWRIGDHGLHHDSLAAGPRADRPAREALAVELAGAARACRSIRSAPGRSTPAARGSSRSSARRPGLDRSALSPSFGVLADYGNMSSATIAIRPPSSAGGPGTPTLRGAGFRPGPCRRGGLARLEWAG